MDKEIYKMSYLYMTTSEAKKNSKLNSLKVNRNAYVKSIISYKITQELASSTLNMVKNLSKELAKNLK